MTRCLYCGAELRPNSRYCLECGQLAESAVPPPAAAAPGGLLAGPPAASVPAAGAPAVDASPVPAPGIAAPTAAAPPVPAPPTAAPPVPAPPTSVGTPPVGATSASAGTPAGRPSTAPVTTVSVPGASVARPPAPPAAGSTAAPLGVGDVPHAAPLPDEGPVAPGGPAPGVVASSEGGLVDGSTVLRPPAPAPDDEPVAMTRRSLRRREQLAAEQAAADADRGAAAPLASVPDEITGVPAPASRSAGVDVSPVPAPAAPAAPAGPQGPAAEEEDADRPVPAAPPVPAARPGGTVGGGPAVEAVLLSFSTGERVAVAGSAVVGRAPQEAARNAGSQAVAVDDPARSVSRVHLFVDVADGRALARDAGSGNGSQLERDGLRRALPEATGTELVAGDRIWIGDVSVDVATAS